MVILDAEGRIEWSNDNAASMLGLDPKADVGQPIGNLVREPAFVDYLETDFSSPALIEGASGASLALKIIPYGEAQKLLLCRDVTQAERVETMRRDFVANVSHELRTPLTVLVGFLETVRELKLDPQRTRDYVDMMREQAARMQRIIEDLLALSVLESAPPPPADRVRMAPLLARVHADAVALSGGRHAISVEGKPSVDLAGSETEVASAPSRPQTIWARAPTGRSSPKRATGATAVQNLAYAQRLGLWGGEDFPFATRPEFVQAEAELMNSYILLA